MAGISNDVEDLRVNRNDFMAALDEVHPAFGVNEEELQQVVQNGIIHFDPVIDVRGLPSLSCPEKGLNLHRRKFFGRGSSLSSKYGHQPGHHSSASFCTGQSQQARRRLRRLSRRHPDIRSSSCCRQTAWLASPSRRRSPRSIRSLRIATRAR